MNEEKLHKHIHETYHVVRIGLAWIAAVFPFLLVGLGYGIYGIPMQETMSHYYFALQDAKIWSFPMRGLFVGVLCAVGCALILYRGYSNTENWLLNAAGGFVIGVALVHMGAPDPVVYGGYVLPWFPWAHYIFAVLFFLAIILVALACSEETLGDLPKDQQQSYRNRYDRHALGMLTFPALAAAVTLATGSWTYVVIAMEAFGVWFFARYWFVKSKEIRMIEEYRRQKANQPSAEAPTGKISTYDNKIELRPEKQPTESKTPKVQPTESKTWIERLAPQVISARKWMARSLDKEKMTELPRLKPEPARAVPAPAES